MYNITCNSVCVYVYIYIYIYVQALLIQAVIVGIIVQSATLPSEGLNHLNHGLSRHELGGTTCLTLVV